jgi:hypothetical protein
LTVNSMHGFDPGPANNKLLAAVCTENLNPEDGRDES